MNYLQNVSDKKGPSVMLPDSSTIHENQQGKLPLSSSLSNEASNVVVILSLKSSSLILLGQLCDDACREILNKKNIYVAKDNQMVLEGHKNLTDGLWDICISYYDVYKNLQTDNHIQPPTHKAMFMATK